MGSTEQLLVSERVKSELEAQKRPGESYTDVIERLIEKRTECRRETIRDGAGTWGESEATERARAARESMKGEIESVVRD
jgi:predicted CopG family antitoxin